MADKSCRRPQPRPQPPPPASNDGLVYAAELLIEQAASGDWVYEPEWSHPTLAGWMRFEKRRTLSVRGGKQTDHMFMSPAGMRFRSLIGAMRYVQQHDSAVVCSACGSGHDEPGNDIVLCDGERCGLAFHQECLPEPLLSVPVGEWLCPGCEAGTPGQVPGGITHGQPRYAPPPPRPLPQAPPPKPVRYQLSVASLRPACTVVGCGGEARHTPDAGATTFACEKCGATLKSHWWAHLLTRGSAPSYEDESDRSSELTVATTTPACSAIVPYSSPAKASAGSPSKSGGGGSLNPKPPGRSPAGFEWDCDRGVWVGQDGQERPRGASRLPDGKRQKIC